MKAVIYARYSSDNQREESIEGQLRECTAYCQKNEITLVRTYIDRALSAKTDNRPDFQRMIKDSAKGLFDVVLVWKLDRFARNRYDSARYKAQLKKYGVKVLSATENISEGPEGIILESLLEGMAEYYSAELAEKVIRGHTENALKCKYNGGTPTFGYTIDSERHYQIDPRTAPVVLEMFTCYDNGATMKEIRDYLNDTGVTITTAKSETQSSASRNWARKQEAASCAPFPRPETAGIFTSSPVWAQKNTSYFLGAQRPVSWSCALRAAAARSRNRRPTENLPPV